MKKLFLSFIAVLFCSACVGNYPSHQQSIQQPKQSRPVCTDETQKTVTHGFSISYFEIPTPPCAGVKVEYQPYEVAISQATSDADTQFMQGEEKEKYLSTVPSGGFAVITMDSISIDVANNQHWRIVTTDEQGKVLSSYDGEFDVPNGFPLYSTTIWKNVLVAPINVEVPDRFKLYVVSTLLNKRWGYDIKKVAQ